MNKLNGAIIGLGKMGISHAAIVSAHPDINLQSVCDTSSLVIDAIRKFTGLNLYSDYKKMIDEESLDLVIIATPTKLHYSMIKYALERGLHVFCEKPFTLTSTQGRELVEIASQKQLVNQVGYHNHFIGTFSELKRLLSKNVIGELIHFTGEAYGPVVTRNKGTTWRSELEEGGGCLNDYASHVINLIQEILGRPTKIHGTLLKNIYSKRVEDAVFSLLELESRLTGTLLVNWSDETYRKMSTTLTILGKKGKFICDATELKIFLKESSVSENLNIGWTIKYITDLTNPVNFYLRGEEYTAQLDYFIENVNNKQVGNLNTFEQAYYTDLVIDMIKENAKSN